MADTLIPPCPQLSAERCRGHAARLGLSREDIRRRLAFHAALANGTVSSDDLRMCADAFHRPGRPRGNGRGLAVTASPSLP